MKFGGLSESDIQEISKILESEGITFQIETDSDIASFNERSIKNNLRHLSPPNISTHILSILIEDKDFELISDQGKENLLHFGITNLPPDPEDFKPFSGETFHQDLIEGPRRMIGASFVHQLLYGVLILILVYGAKYLFGL